MKKLIRLPLLLILTLTIWVPVIAQSQNDNDVQLLPVSFCLSYGELIQKVNTDIHMVVKNDQWGKMEFIIVATTSGPVENSQQPGFYVKNGEQWCWVGSLFEQLEVTPSYVDIYQPKADNLREITSDCEKKFIQLVYLNKDNGNRWIEIFSPESMDVIAVSMQ